MAQKSSHDCKDKAVLRNEKPRGVKRSIWDLIFAGYSTFIN